MYAPSTTSTTSESRRCSSNDRRVRVVRLVRPRRPSPAFGFWLRGGREHATGFFISRIEPSSVAQANGLKVGDHVVSINGYRVEDAVHSELAHYIATQTRLKIKVRNVGMIPVKEKVHDPLSWLFVSDPGSICSAVSSSPTLCHATERMADMRLSILVPPRAKLGCGICKGPEWKPGIFVQFVRDGGIAQEAGLRPGDQILSCNGQDFYNISFNEAIQAMKVNGRLELIVREGAGIELVSPESSGYNSSASSAAGERSPAPAAPAPPATLCRRLASVAEEAADRADRKNFSRLKRRTWDSLDFVWKNGEEYEIPSDIEPDYDCPSIPNNPHNYDNQKRNLLKKDFVTSPSNRTIINLTEEGATIQCNYDQTAARKTTFSNMKNNDKKTIFVEVHHTTNNAQCVNSYCAIPPPAKEFPADNASTNSLSSAIAEEIQRRKMLKKTTGEDNVKNNEIATKDLKKIIPKPIENEKKKHHDALMDEFKKVHKKMFANQDKEDTENKSSIDRQPTLPLSKVQNATSDDVTDNAGPVREAGDDPPPPPPMPVENGDHNGDIKVMINKIQNKLNKVEPTMNGNTPKFNVKTTNGSVTRTPTPDYNNISETLSQVKIRNKTKEDDVELNSLESFKLKNPAAMEPKPPSNYFMRAPNGTATMKKNVRPVSVTIGEYGNGGLIKRQPSKLDFLSQDKCDVMDSKDEPITNKLQSELAMTLSRSNLRKKTDSLDDDGMLYDLKPKSDKYFHARYGNNILPLPPSITIPKASSRKHSAITKNI